MSTNTTTGTLEDSVVLTPDEAAQVLKVTRQTIYAMIKRGELRRYHVGRSARIPTRDVLAIVGSAGDDVSAA